MVALEKEADTAESRSQSDKCIPIEHGTSRPIRYTVAFDVSHVVSRDLPPRLSSTLALLSLFLTAAVTAAPLPHLPPIRGGALCKMRRKAAGNESNVPDVSIISYTRVWPLICRLFDAHHSPDDSWRRRREMVEDLAQLCK